MGYSQNQCLAGLWTGCFAPRTSVISLIRA